jgi:hypothetical protein
MLLINLNFDHLEKYRCDKSEDEGIEGDKEHRALFSQSQNPQLAKTEMKDTLKHYMNIAIIFMR